MVTYRSGQQSTNVTTNAPTRVPRSVLDRSLRHSSTMKGGELVPMFVDEVLPGDTVRLDATFFSRLLIPLGDPSLDELQLDAQAFFVPFRLLWSNWKKMMGEREDPSDHNSYLTPKLDPPIDNNGFQAQSLSDYFGIRTETDNLVVTSLYHRAYQKIWNDFYRDENLQDSIDVPTGDGPDPSEFFTILKRGKRKDYITGALPFLQKGAAVTIPIGESAPITGSIIGTPGPGWDGQTSGANATGTSYAAGGLQVGGTVTGTFSIGEELHWDPDTFDVSGLEANLSAAGGINIADFRELVSTQHLLERDARGGTRYVELLQSHFGVTPEDSRLQRSEFLWSTSGSMTSHVVPATAQAGPDTVGSLGGYMQGINNARGFTKSFTEHGALMILVSVRAPLRYQQNIPKMFKRDNRFDYYWPDFALLSEQPVYNYEVFADGTAADDDVFGYQPRYEEYRRRESMISGILRSDYPAGSLDSFHLAQDFLTRPALDADFIEEDPPIGRITSIDVPFPIIIDASFKIKHVRPMPMFANPGLMRL